MRKRTWVEMPISAKDRQNYTLADRVVSVRVKNQGTATMLTGWNSESTPNQILPGTSDTFDAGDSAYMEGALTIDFAAAGNPSGIVLLLKDSPDNCD